MATPATTKCPKCGGTTVEATAFTEADLDDMVTCPNCRGRFVKREFLADIVDEGMQLIKDGLRDIPGFKPK